MGPIQKFLTLIRKEPNSQNSAFSRKDYRIYLYYKFDLIFQPITPFVGLSSQCSEEKEGLKFGRQIFWKIIQSWRSEEKEGFIRS